MAYIWRRKGLERPIFVGGSGVGLGSFNKGSHLIRKEYTFNPSEDEIEFHLCEPEELNSLVLELEKLLNPIVPNKTRNAGKKMESDYERMERRAREKREEIIHNEATEALAQKALLEMLKPRPKIVDTKE